MFFFYCCFVIFFRIAFDFGNILIALLSILYFIKYINRYLSQIYNKQIPISPLVFQTDTFMYQISPESNYFEYQILPRIGEKQSTLLKAFNKQEYSRMLNSTES